MLMTVRTQLQTQRELNWRQIPKRYRSTSWALAIVGGDDNFVRLMLDKWAASRDWHLWCLSQGSPLFPWNALPPPGGPHPSLMESLAPSQQTTSPRRSVANSEGSGLLFFWEKSGARLAMPASGQTRLEPSRGTPRGGAYGALDGSSLVWRPAWQGFQGSVWTLGEYQLRRFG